MALFNARITNTNTVAGILSDFQEKVKQLNDLALNRRAVIEKRSQDIDALIKKNDEDQAEAERAVAAANKIQSLFN